VQGGTVTLGIARSELVARSVAEDESAVTLVAPFDPTVTPVGGGRYDGARTLFGLGIELER